MNSVAITSAQSKDSVGFQTKPTMELKTVSAIPIDKKFLIPRQERTKSGLYLYNNLLTAKRSEWSWVSLVAQVIWPDVPQVTLNRKHYKDLESLWKVIHTSWVSSGIQAAVSVKKLLNEKKFQVTVPIFVAPSEGFPPGMVAAAMAASGDKGFFSKPNYKEVFVDKEAALRTGARFPIKTLKPMGSLNVRDTTQIVSSDATLIIKNFKTSFSAALLEFHLSQREVEFLTNSPWIEIRPLEVYGLIRNWVDGSYGMVARSASYSIPLERIAKASDSNTSTPRTSEDGLLLDEHGAILALPNKLNSVAFYEEQASASFTHSDGSFSAVSPEGEYVKPPAATPVYVDWVNLKFAYSSQTGKLLIKNLDRSQPLNVSHIRRFLDKPIGSDLVSNFISFTIALADFFGLPTGSMDSKKFHLALEKDVEKLNNERGLYADYSLTPLRVLYDYTSPDQEHLSAASDVCKTFIELAEQVLKFINTNPANAYGRYSVPTIIELKGQLTVFCKYVTKYTDVSAQDNTARKAYIEQQEDPNFKLDAVPFVNSDMGLMPHQTRVENKLRGGPQNAILPVDAGGGKTALILYEVLREMKNSNPGNCLIMCPAHLVAQYVKEFVYFTGSRVNVIPVTTYTIRRHGLERLKTMILHAPKNSVVVTDYHAIVLGKQVLSYGVAPIATFPIIEFLRRFTWKYVACDESHFLKNKSVRNTAVGRLLIEIPKKRLASGTLVTDTVIDLVNQMALMDPSVFGTVDDFIKEYALEVRGTKVLQWQPGAELAIRRMLKDNLVIAEARRKEWAAILPYPVERFHPVTLTEAQFRTYQSIMQKVIEEIQAKAEENATLKALLNGEDVEDSELDLNALLKPYLARLERFITAPGKDVLGKELLSGKDLVSPKVLKIVEICQEHLNKNIPGKVLIFTNYTYSAEAIYEAFPESMRPHVIYYTAGNKEECGALFEKDDSKKIMVGIEASMNTGLNLQFCSRLIRTETVWSPGVLEQGNSRIGRPNIKEKEARSEIYYDWIIANQTIDVTKISYLMSKSISKAKFDEAGNRRFDELEVPPLFSMTLENIFVNNDFQDTMLDYYEKYEAYKQALYAEYTEYRNRNKSVLFDSNGKLKMMALERAPNPPDSAQLLRVPYVPGTELYKAEDLGLVRYDEYMHLDEEDLETDEEEGEEDVSEVDTETDDDAESSDKKAALADERRRATGLSVHTDFGDGEIARVNARMLRVRLPSGDYVRVRKLAAFIITRANTSNKDLRTQLLKMTGDVPIAAPIEVLEIGKVPPKKVGKNNGPDAVVKAPPKEDVVEMELDFTIINDFLGIRLENTDNEAAVRVAQSFGFKHSPTYYAAHVKRPIQMLELFRRWSELGLKMPKENSDACHKTFLHFKTNKNNAVRFYGMANQNNIRNFYRMLFKPTPDKMFIQPYPLIQDDALWIALPANGHPGSLNAMRKAPVSGLKWWKFDSDAEMIAFTPRKEAASSLIKTLLKEGVVISNLEELSKKFKKLRVVQNKVED